MILDANGIDTAEAVAQQAVSGTHHELQQKRAVLNADELAAMTDLRPRLEKEIDLRGVDGTRQHVFLFSIDGLFEGVSVRGALFAGECIMVTAKDFEAAFRIAKDGLHDTVELLRKEFEGRVAADAMAGMELLAAGQKAAEGGALHPKLNAIMAHRIGGLPWRN